MTMQCVEAQEQIVLSEQQVQLIADRIVEEILRLGQKSISTRKIVKMVDTELQKAGG